MKAALAFAANQGPADSAAMFDQQTITPQQPVVIR